MDLNEKRRRIERQCEYLERSARFARGQLKTFDKQMERAEHAEACGRHCACAYLHWGANIHLLRAAEYVDHVFGLAEKVKEGLTDKGSPSYPANGPCNITLYRAPCLMEDEGRHFESGVFTHWNAAKEILDELTDNNTGYFKYSNYYFVSDDTAPVWWPCDKGNTPSRTA
jgi:hypothetical protein